MQPTEKIESLAKLSVFVRVRMMASLWRETLFRARDVSRAQRGISSNQILSKDKEILQGSSLQDTSLALSRQRLAKLLCLILPAFLISGFTEVSYKGKPNQPLRILIYGDAGSGDKEQYRVGKGMQQRDLMMNYDFAVSMGDNQYIDGPNIYESVFEIPYAGLIDRKTMFFQTIGNHDLENDRLSAQLEYHRKTDALSTGLGGWVLPAENYVINGDRFLWIVINVSHPTNIISISSETVALTEKYLCQPSTKWKIVGMHYPMWSTGPRGDNQELQKVFLPIFLRCPPDFIFAGHEHHAEVLKPWNWIFNAIIGNASILRSGRSISEQESLVFYGESGFAEMTLEEDVAKFSLLSSDGVQFNMRHIQKRPPVWADTWFYFKNRIYGRVSVLKKSSAAKITPRIAAAEFGLSPLAVSPFDNLQAWTFFPASLDTAYFSSVEHEVYAADLPRTGGAKYAIFRYKLEGDKNWYYGDIGDKTSHGNYDGISPDQLLQIP